MSVCFYCVFALTNYYWKTDGICILVHNIILILDLLELDNWCLVTTSPSRTCFIFHLSFKRRRCSGNNPRVRAGPDHWNALRIGWDYGRVWWRGSFLKCCGNQIRSLKWESEDVSRIPEESRSLLKAIGERFWTHCSLIVSSGEM